MFLKATLLTFALALLVGVKAHSQKIDSLKNELLRQDGEGRFSTLYDLVFEYLDKLDYQEAFKYIDEAQRVAARYDDSLHIVKAGRVKGQILRKMERTKEAIAEYQKVLPVSKRNNFVGEYEYILNEMAIVHMVRADYDKALRLHFECLALREKGEDTENLAITIFNIATVYNKLGNYEKALEYYERVHKYKTRFDDHVLTDMGFCYLGLDDFQSARKFPEDVIRNCAPNCSNETLVRAEFGIGKALFYSNEIIESQKHLIVSYKLAKKTNSKAFQIYNLVFLVKIKLALGRREGVKGLLVEAESMANDAEYNDDLLYIYTEFIKLYTEAQRYKDASFYQAKYITLKDSIYSGELTKNLMRIQADNDERENKAKIASQEQFLRLNEEVIAKQRGLNFLIGTVAVLFVMLTLIFFKLSRQRRSMNVLLDRKVEERTLALEQSLSDLRRSHDDQEILLYNISSDMKASVATLRGLCALSTGLSDKPGASILYVKEFEETAGRIAEIVNRVQRVSKK